MAIFRPRGNSAPTPGISGTDPSMTPGAVLSGGDVDPTTAEPIAGPEEPREGLGRFIGRMARVALGVEPDWIPSREPLLPPFVPDADPHGHGHDAHGHGEHGHDGRAVDPNDPKESWEAFQRAQKIQDREDEKAHIIAVNREAFPRLLPFMTVEEIARRARGDQRVFEAWMAARQAKQDEWAETRARVAAEEQAAERLQQQRQAELIADALAGRMSDAASDRSTGTSDPAELDIIDAEVVEEDPSADTDS